MKSVVAAAGGFILAEVIETTRWLHEKNRRAESKEPENVMLCQSAVTDPISGEVHKRLRPDPNATSSGTVAPTCGARTPSRTPQGVEPGRSGAGVGDGAVARGLGAAQPGGAR